MKLPRKKKKKALKNQWTKMETIRWGLPAYRGGDGLLSQIQSGSKQTYTELTEDVLKDYMNDLFNKTQTSPPQYVAYCGQHFMDMFDKAMGNNKNNIRWGL